MTSRKASLAGLAAVVAVAALALMARGEGGSEVIQDPPGEVVADGSATTSSLPSSSPDEVESEAPVVEEPETAIPVLRPAPELSELDGWLQSEVSSLDELHGKVVVLQFWTFGCFNCKNTLPHLQELAARHDGAPFEIVGVHAPEFEYERDPAAIAEAAERLGVTWPIALDTERRNFRAWQGSPAYWPRTYVIDQEGNIRFDHIGEGAYEELADTVARLLGET